MSKRTGEPAASAEANLSPHLTAGRTARSRHVPSRSARALLVAGGLVVAIVVVTLLASSRGGTPSAHEIAYSGRVGLAVSYNLFEHPEPYIQSQLAQIRGGGVSWIREDVSWAVIEPRRGQFDWRRFDGLMEAAARTQVHVLGILDYSAPWASSDPTGAQQVVYPPQKNSEFADYAAAIASRYGSHGLFWKQHPGLAPDPMTAVEIWNEPYGSWSWKPRPDPPAYAALVRSTAPAIHAADPQMRVLMSGDLDSYDRSGSGDTRVEPWIARVLAADPRVATLVNGLDVHPYPAPRNAGPFETGHSVRDSFGRVALIRQVELNAGVRLPIWITEVGWTTSPYTAGAVSDQTQATFVRQAVQRSLDDWGDYVPKIFLFGWYRSNNIARDPSHNEGLLTPVGEPKPAWITLTHLLHGVPGKRDADAPTST